ncbi:MAG: outer membrane protein assembly factor BamE [Pyrinomonadaceae bacterium]|nr:outer membrane protein assembly factor BamE [Pyrinomonadaceae bacterium]
MSGLRPGMTKAQVIGLLGQPTASGELKIKKYCLGTTGSRAAGHGIAQTTT